MCFGGGNKVDQQPATATASPPSPVATESSASATANKQADQRRRVAAIKYGIASTQKTGPLGDLTMANTLTPSILGMGYKTKLGA